MNVTLKANKASGLSREEPGLVLEFTAHIENDYDLDKAEDRQTLSYHLETQGKHIAHAMRQAVPSGTLEALIAELLRLQELDEWKAGVSR